jgi:hypothetical protein
LHWIIVLSIKEKSYLESPPDFKRFKRDFFPDHHYNKIPRPPATAFSKGGLSPGENPDQNDITRPPLKKWEMEGEKSKE